MKDRMKELIELLNRANKAYYSGDEELISNKNYDSLYGELEALEAETGIVYPNSPTQNVGYEVVGSLKKEKHQVPMLSLDKSKNIEDLKMFLGRQEGLLSYKLDGLTVVLTYDDGRLTKAVTRGDGVIGEDITHNAKGITNIPVRIPYKGHLVVRGEAVISYSDFMRINELLPAEEQYKNPRNLCSGSIRLLNSSATAKRNIQFIAFNLVTIEEELALIEDRLQRLHSLGFACVTHNKVDSENIEAAVKDMTEISKMDIPVDGLVLTYNDYAYGIAQGHTAKFDKHSFAFKWGDEEKRTILREVEWNTSRIGLINPVAVFDPVELEGTTVTRATLNNVKFIKDLELGIGDEITVYKSNMIIPTIADNLTRSNTLQLPTECPTCGAPVKTVVTSGTTVLICTGEDCPAKITKHIANFVKRDAMDIAGMSEATIDVFVARGWISTLADVYQLKNYKTKMMTLEGFGSKKVSSLLAAIEASRKVKLSKFITALGIPGIGRAQGKAIAATVRTWEGFFNRLKSGSFSDIESIGSKKSETLLKWYDNGYHSDEVELLVQEFIEFEEEEKESSLLEGKTLCITGTLNTYSRKELKELIEKMGGKVSSAVSKRTSYLINNDLDSNTSKNKTAKELGIPIITEKDFIEKIGKSA